MEKDAGVSAEHPPLTLLGSWLVVEKTRNEVTPPYCHLLLRQIEDVDENVWDEIYAYINHAHEGARKALRAPLEDTLHPLHYGTKADPAFGYPHRFGDNTLKGFFGEIIAGIVAEYYAGDGEYNWEVPAYLFCTHVIAFQQLELMKQTGDWDRQIFGRTGDDVLAFARDGDGNVVAWLACEAKCTGGHSSALIIENHKKLSQALTQPIDLLRVIEALEDYRNEAYARDWIVTLRDFYIKGYGNEERNDRRDLSVYICGKSPQVNRTWVTTDKPHRRYTGGRNLTSAEVHLPDVEHIIRSLYNRMDGSA